MFMNAMNRFCQLTGTQHQSEYTSKVAGPKTTWTCTLRVGGIDAGFRAQGLSKKQAQEAATIAFLEHLQVNGYLDDLGQVKKKQKTGQEESAVEAKAKEGGEALPTVSSASASTTRTSEAPKPDPTSDFQDLEPEPDDYYDYNYDYHHPQEQEEWEYQNYQQPELELELEEDDGPSNAVDDLPAHLRPKPKMLPAASNRAGPDESVAPAPAPAAMAAAAAAASVGVPRKACKTNDALYQHLLDILRRGKADAAVALLQREAYRFEGQLSVSQLSKAMQCVGARTDISQMKTLLEAIDSSRLVTFENADVKCYYNRFISWIVREMLTQARDMISLASQQSARTLEMAGTCIPAMKATGGKGGTDLVLLPLKVFSNSREFQKGDWLFVTFPPEGLVGATPGEGSSASFEAEIMVVTSASLAVKVFGSTNLEIQAFHNKPCRVDRMANRVTYYRQIDALKAFTTPGEGEVAPWLRSALTAGLRPEGPPTGLTPEVSALSRPHFMIGAEASSPAWRLANESQTAALRAALTRRVTLIQGPPGTGKTHTSVLLVRLLTAAGRGPVLVCADSNVAVDNLLSSLVAFGGLNCVRIGRPDVTRPDLESYNILERSKEASSSTSAVTAPTGAANLWTQEKRVLAAAQVVCCTCSGADHPVLQQKTFESVIIDEAAQATEPSTLLPLLRLSSTGSCTLVGDHKQLAPTVVSQDNEAEGFGQSLFARFIGLGLQPLLLEHQYRMHPALAAYPSHRSYDSRLRSAVTGKQRPAPGGIRWPDPCVPLTFLPVPGQEVKAGTSFTNPAEVTVIEDILASVMEAQDLKPHQIGIITPYQGQVSLIRQHLQASSKLPQGTVERGRSAGLGVEIMTVDGFQGREKELIIVSTVRANTDSKVGFLADGRRHNVTLTRARRGIVVCGHFPTLARDAQSWGPWLAWMWARGLVVGYEATDHVATARLRALNGLEEDELLAVAGAT